MGLPDGQSFMKDEESLLTKHGTLVRSNWRTHADWHTSNLCLVDDYGRILWRSEMPASDQKDCWPNPLFDLTEDTVKCISLDGWECTIDLRTGRILNKEWGK